MKGLVLSGGKGVRLRPITHTRAKQLLPVANRPILFYGLESLRASGIEDVGIVVGDTKEEIKNAVGDGSAFGLKVTYIEQEAPLGLAHAVMVAEEFVNREPFVMYLGDNLLLEGIKPAVDKFEREGSNCQILLAEVENPERFGVATVQDGRIVRLVEKPKNPESNLALVGVYLFDHHVFSAVKGIKPSLRGELEITDAIQWLVDKSFDVRYDIVRGWWKDTGRIEDLLEANRIILDSLSLRLDGEISASSSVDFKVVVEAGAKVIDSTIRGPALIGSETQIINSYIGPFTSVGSRCCLEGCEVEHSIIMSNSIIAHVAGRISDSLVGENCHLYQVPQRPKAFRFMLGDNSQVGIAN